MALSSDRWKVISHSNYEWEREALDYIRANLPDVEPYRAWANFEFIADDGTINEIDILIITPCGFFLIETKSRGGSLSGDAMTWVWRKDGKALTLDNPLLLANRKAKKLASLIKKQKACQKTRVPFLEPLIFCSALQIQCHLPRVAGNKICFRDDNPYGAGRGILDALKNGRYPGSTPHLLTVIDRPTAKAISLAMDQAGIRPSQKSRRVSDYILGDLLYESPTGAYQDWAATHSKIETSKRRIRIYNIAKNVSEMDREMIRRAAHREFQILEEIIHPGILRVDNFTEHELGPALIFRHYPEAVRLDHYLAQHAESLTLDLKLSLIRQIAETLKFAHEKKLVHRALSPQSILVTDPESSSPQIKIFNWQASYRRTSGTTLDTFRVAPTSHLEQLIEETSTVYLAPEAALDPESSGEKLDIFSLGALTYHIFSGKAPAETKLELNEKLSSNKGLQISAVMDGAGRELQELIQYSTHPDRMLRWDTIADFIGQLDRVEDELTRPDEDYIENPLDAKVNDRLAGGFLVKSRLGKGASATAFVIEKDGREVVLKLANDIEHNEYLREEAERIKKLSHPTIIVVYDVVEISGLVGFTMQKVAPDTQKEVQTLAQRLRTEGRLSTDFLQRFGEDLLEAVNYLEQVGTPHRDIKPDNMAIGRLHGDGRLRLVLFDFSLSRVPFDKLGAGTPPYLEPFLSDRKRWDLHAERFAAAVTLYEMATGNTPVWGDGISHPSMLDCEATLNEELFDPNLREAFGDFFAKALRRDYRCRFDNGLEMLRAWRKIFETVDQTRMTSSEEGEFDLETILETATLTTEVSSLGLSTRVMNALDRINVITVSELRAISLGRVNSLRGIGNKTKREIAMLVYALRDKFPLVEPLQVNASDTEDREPAMGGIDLIAPQIIKVASASKKQNESAVLCRLLGLDQSGNVTNSALDWPSQSDVARQMSLSLSDVAQIVALARERWRKKPSIAPLRKTIAELIEANGWAMTLGELCTALLAARGSSEYEPRRTLQACIVIRAALEVERSGEKPRFVDRRLQKDGVRVILMAQTDAMADYAEHLSRAADELAELDPIATPARTLERLREVQLPEEIAPLSDSRLVRLAAAASFMAALSGRLEIYPRGMSAERALRLAHGALAGTRELTIEEIRQRVQSRYPESEPLPSRPMLDELLQAVGLDLTWSPDAAHGKGAYIYPEFEISGLSSSTITTGALSTSGINSRPSLPMNAAVIKAELPPEIADARILENKLQRAAKEGSFLVLTASPKHLLDAETELLRRFDLERRNLDEIFIRVMRQQATNAKVDWNVVLQADARPGSQDWRNLMILVGRSLPLIENELSQADKTLLLVYPGLLARYKQLNLLERLRDKIGTTGSRLHGVWVLIPSDEQVALPVLDKCPVPVISNNQWARIPEAWIVGTHQNNYHYHRQ